jgi:hypothetical protein
MSWRAYQTLSIQPDFTNEPFLGLVESRAMVEIGQAPAWATWRADTPLAFAFDWMLMSPAETRSFRDFTNHLGGRSTPFFLPSWSPDYVLAEPTTVGGVTIRVKAAGFSDLTDERPDTDGRQLFLVSTAGEFQPCSVIGAVLDGDDEILTVDFPISYNFDPARTMVGKLYLVRLADDRVEFEFIRPGQGKASLRAVTARQTRRVNMQEALGSEAVFSLKAFSDVIAADLNPLLATFTAPTTVGPETYGVPQGDNFFREWSAFATVGGVTLQSSKPGASPIPSVLYDSSFQTRHLAFAFDASGNESIAWETEAGQIRLAYKAGGSNHWLNFTGISPVMFQTWTIDGTITAGNADLVIFYIREGYSGIFARFYRESFATEHLVARSPTAPIYLQLARRFEGRIEVVGMDAGHRLARWRTLGYLTPPERQFSIGNVDGVEGLYRSVTVFAVGQENPTGNVDGIGGEYRSIRVFFDIPSDEVGLGFVQPLVTGTYTEIRVATNPAAEGQAGKLDSTIPGEYKLIRKTADVVENASGSVTGITGSYG